VGLNFSVFFLAALLEALGFGWAVFAGAAGAGEDVVDEELAGALFAAAAVLSADTQVAGASARHKTAIKRFHGIIIFPPLRF
jgi:ABC-type proline/glycine betaine transport system permease subunit